MSSDILLTRRHAILDERADQLRHNIMAVAGGRPYIAARLWRAPNESDLSWSGTSHLTLNPGVTGRVNRAVCIHDAGRVAGKINQYLFAEDVSRAGIDADWARDVTGTGVSVHDFWEDVSTQVTAAGWCWVQIDRDAPAIDPATGRPAARSRRDRELAGDRVRWLLWPAASVVDWRFDTSGRLVWLLTDEETYDNSDPTAEAKAGHLRRLWRREAGGATWESWTAGKDGKATMTASGSISSPDVPFVLVGTPSAEPWWFDSIEGLQAQVMNVDSLHVENLTRTVFPQLVIPSSALDSLEARLIERAGQSNGGRILELVREVVRGLDAPMVETAEDSGITRYITPSSSDLDALPKEIDRKRRMLFDAAGLVLFNRETRQVQSAEARQFDHLDTEATLRHRAIMLQEAEARVVEASKSIDTYFAVYEPVWPESFDVIDVAETASGLVDVGNLGNLTLTQRKVLLHAATRLLDGMTRISEEQRTAINDEIEALQEEDFSFRLPAPDVDGPANDVD